MIQTPNISRSYVIKAFKFVKCPLGINRDDYVASLLGFVSMVCYIIDLCMLNQPFISGMKPTRSWCMTLLMYSGIQFARAFFAILFAFVFIQDFFILFCLPQILVSRWYWLSRMNLAVFLCFSMLWNKCQRINSKSCLKDW